MLPSHNQTGSCGQPRFRIFSYSLKKNSHQDGSPIIPWTHSKFFFFTSLILEHLRLSGVIPLKFFPCADLQLYRLLWCYVRLSLYNEPCNHSKSWGRWKSSFGGNWAWENLQDWYEKLLENDDYTIILFISTYSKTKILPIGSMDGWFLWKINR